MFALTEYLDLQQFVSNVTFVFNVAKHRLLYIVVLSATQVGLWKGRVDRQCIERMKNFQNPPLLVGQVMEMVMTLIGKRLPNQRLEIRPDSYPTRDGESGRFSSSSSSTKFTTKKSKCLTLFYSVQRAIFGEKVPPPSAEFAICPVHNLPTIPKPISSLILLVLF